MGKNEYDHHYAHRYKRTNPPTIDNDIDMDPLHNDYLELLTEGGLIGFGLFVIGMVGCIWLGFKNYIIFRRYDKLDLAFISLVLAIMLVASMQVIMANPVMNEPQCGFYIYFASSIIIIVDRLKKFMILENKRIKELTKCGKTGPT